MRNVEPLSPSPLQPVLSVTHGFPSGVSGCYLRQLFLFSLQWKPPPCPAPPAEWERVRRYALCAPQTDPPHRLWAPRPGVRGRPSESCRGRSSGAATWKGSSVLSRRVRVLYAQRCFWPRRAINFLFPKGKTSKNRCWLSPCPAFCSVCLVEICAVP